MSETVNPFANVKIATQTKKQLTPVYDEAEETDVTADAQPTVQAPEPSIQTPPTEEKAIEETASEPVPTPAIKATPARSPSHKIEPKVMEKIKEASIQQGYRSDSRGKKETTKTHAYTFYPSDIKAVRRIKMAVMEDDIDINVSDSEVMRAAVAALNALPYEEQKRLILDQKDR